MTSSDIKSMSEHFACCSDPEKEALNSKDYRPAGFLVSYLHVNYISLTHVTISVMQHFGFYWTKKQKHQTI